jgi:hypothetical protein
MSGEQLPNQEIYTAPELTDNHNLDVNINKAGESEKNEKLIDIDKARAKVLEQPPQHLALPIDDSTDANQPQYIDRTIKSISLKNELKAIRQKLPLDQKLLSKTIHQPIIRRSSEATAKTIARPVGLLGGGILAFIGSLAYLFFAKYIGIKYNYLVFIMLFVLGYVLASILELLTKSLSKTKNTY